MSQAKRSKKTVKVAVIRFPEAERQALKVVAAREGRTMESAILEAFRYWSARKRGEIHSGETMSAEEMWLRRIMESGDQSKITTVNTMLEHLFRTCE